MSKGFLDDVIIASQYKDEAGHPNIEYQDLDAYPDEERRHWYHSFCNEDDIQKILHPQNGCDYILKLNANHVAFNTRLWRYFLHLSRDNGKEWSFANYFHAYNYIEFKHTLSKEKQEICENVSYGTVFTEDPNGFVFSSPFGPCSVCSTAVKWSSKYSTLALIDFGDKVPSDIQWRSLIIATRLALGTESYDFEMDPRGIIPPDIDKELYRPYPFQSIFIAGHEYGHYLLGHLNENSTTKTSFLRPHFKDDNDYRKIDTYNVSQKHEFDADLFAMNEPRMEDRYYDMYYHSVMLWFASQVIFETVEDTICPPYGYQSHPGAKARYKNIIENARKPKNFSEKYYCEDLVKLVDSYSEKMRDLAMSNTELFERYGSFYLAEPNTKWRGRELTDRIDY